jgi:hypothetical protein
MDDIRDYSYYLTHQAEATPFRENARRFREQLQKVMKETPDMRAYEYLSHSVLRGNPRLDYEHGICIEDDE